MYKKYGSYFITDLYKGSNYVKRYKTKKPEPETSSLIGGKTSGYPFNDFSNEIFKASKKYGINEKFIKAIITAESNFKADAVSPKETMELMQLMPKTALSLKVEDPFNPYQNIDGGTKHLKHLLKQFKGNKHLALAAYNVGEHQVKKYGTISPFKETSSFLAALIFGLASFTDWLDGHIARSTNQVTNFGKLIDPVADKLLLIAALVPLVGMGRVSGWVVVVIICREFAVFGLRILNSHQGIIIPASNLSKYKMAVMITSIILLILNYHIFFISFQFLGTVILWMVLTLSIISGIDCFIKSWSVIDIET